MHTPLDIDVLPIFRRGGFDQATLPGLHLAVPPRRTPRSRASDILVLFLDLHGNAPISPNQQNQLLTGVARTYYHHRGSVTAALQDGANRLNQYLLDRNLRSASSGLQATGLLTIAAFRGTRLYLAQSGPTHAFVVTPEESRHLYDTAIAGRGLGTSRTTAIRFFQTDMGEGGLVLISPAPPPTWTTLTLKESYQLRIERLHHHLVNQAGPDLTAVLLKVQPGNGALNLLQPMPGSQSSPPPPSEPPARPQVTATPARAAAEAPRTAEQMPPGETPALPPEETSQMSNTIPGDLEGEPPPASQDQVAGPVEAATSPGHRAAAPAGPAIAIEQAPARRRTHRPTPPGAEAGEGRAKSFFGPALLAVGRALRVTWESALAGLKSALGRMLPGEGAFALPSYVMFLIAVLVPVIVVTIASVVYFQRGLTTQHQVYLNQAALAASQTLDLDDPNERRAGWQQTMHLLATAEAYGISEDSSALHNQAQAELDQLDAVTRLDFQPALTTRLGNATHIVRMAATNDDLYMLNQDDGNVLRAFLTGRGYVLDPNFSCGPGTYGSFIVGPLVDLATLPKGNEFNATVLAIDGNGNLIYCIPGNPPISAPLVPPDSNWGQPLALSLDSGSLYILDPQTNAVWFYRGSGDLFPDRPGLFFSEQIPPLQDATDLAVNRQDLYLVHADGHLTTCTYSGLAESPTRCTDPATLIDTRPGRQEGPRLADASFTQIQFTPPPDPSIYLLDPNNQAIYHFSLRLTLQRQFRAQEPLADGPATAFTISPNRTVFLAVGNQVFYTNLP